MSKRKRRSFTPEFKAEAVNQVLKKGRSINEVSEELGLYWSTLGKWVDQAKADKGKAAPGALTTEEREELKRLRREVKNLREEKDILKKAAAFFAKESS